MSSITNQPAKRQKRIPSVSRSLDVTPVPFSWDKEDGDELAAEFESPKKRLRTPSATSPNITHAMKLRSAPHEDPALQKILPPPRQPRRFFKSKDIDKENKVESDVAGDSGTSNTRGPRRGRGVPMARRGRGIAKGSTRSVPRVSAADLQTSAKEIIKTVSAKEVMDATTRIMYLRIAKRCIDAVLDEMEIRLDELPKKKRSKTENLKPVTSLQISLTQEMDVDVITDDNDEHAITIVPWSGSGNLKVTSTMAEKPLSSLKVEQSNDTSQQGLTGDDNNADLQSFDTGYSSAGEEILSHLDDGGNSLPLKSFEHDDKELLKRSRRDESQSTDYFDETLLLMEVSEKLRAVTNMDWDVEVNEDELQELEHIRDEED